jgi:hypothetical protein
MLTTLFMLVYGDYPVMHKQAITPLLSMDPKKVAVRLWLNAVCLETFDWLLQNAPEHWLIYISSQNVSKYPVMRMLFNDPVSPIVTPWVTWLDDDTNIVRNNWLAHVTAFIDTNPTAVYFGRTYWKRHLAGVERWIHQAKWYTKRPFMQAKDWYKNKRRKGNGIAFMRGSYWWLKLTVLRALDWPDPRLQHNGGDTALAEAIWQARLPYHKYYYGIAEALAPRRGRSENPAGFTHKCINSTDGSVASMLGRMEEYASRLVHTNTPFLRLNSSTLLKGAPSDYAADGLLWPDNHVKLQSVKPRSVTPLSKTNKPKVARRQRPLSTTAKVVRKSQFPTRRPASKQVNKIKITAGYMQAVSAVRQPVPRATSAPRRVNKTLKQLLQERHQKQRG